MLARHDAIQLGQALKIYTDSSGFQGHVGSAVVVPALNTCFAAYPGTESISTEYAAELKRI
jgi:hypothetical protein